MESKAVLRLARVSTRKACLVADLIRGADVGEALEILSFTRRKPARLLRGVLLSAVANAEHQASRSNRNLDIDRLYVKAVFIDQGPSLRRFRPRARGMATRIRKKTSHITVVLESE